MVIAKPNLMGNCFRRILNGISYFDGDKVIRGIKINFPMFFPVSISAWIEYLINFFTDNLVPLQRPSFKFKFLKRIIIAPIFNCNLCGGRSLGINGGATRRPPAEPVSTIQVHFRRNFGPRKSLRQRVTQCHHAGSRNSWHSTSADQIPQEPLRQQYHKAVGHRLVIRVYQSDARSRARGSTIPGNIQPCYRSAPSFTSTRMWLPLQREDCSCHGLRGRSGSTRRLVNRSTTSTRLDEYLPGDLWPTLEHEPVSHSLDRR